MINEKKVRDALAAVTSRLYPDSDYERYLDELSNSLAELVSDDEPDSLSEAAVRQAADAIGALRRSRNELRHDLNTLALALDDRATGEGARDEPLSVAEANARLRGEATVRVEE